MSNGDEYERLVFRDTIVHIAASLVGFVALSLVDKYRIGPETGATPIVGFVLFYGLVFGGAHLYLAIRGEDGMIPVEARWRYLAALAILLAAGALVSYGGERTIASVSLWSIGLAVISLTVVSYVVTESIAGYRSSRSARTVDS